MNKKYSIGILLVIVIFSLFWFSNRKTATQNSDVSQKSVYTDSKKTFSFEYPKEVSITSGEVLSTIEWRQMTERLGDLLVTATLPREFQPKTNFSEVKFTVGKSADKDAVKNCLVEANNFGTSSSVVIYGSPFTVFTMNDAGAGNFYETKSYRTVRDGACYIVEYTIHSTNIGNYSPDQGIVLFDRAKVDAIFQGMVQSFKFI